MREEIRQLVESAVVQGEESCALRMQHSHVSRGWQAFLTELPAAGAAVWGPPST